MFDLRGSRKCSLTSLSPWHQQTSACILPAGLSARVVFFLLPGHCQDIKDALLPFFRGTVEIVVEAEVQDEIK